MRLRFSTDQLAGARKRMGAEVRRVVLNRRRLGPLGEHEFALDLITGIEIQLKDVETNTGGLLAYRGYQVVLYIPDQGGQFAKVLRNGTEGKKYHVADCLTLNNMRSQNRFERYHVRNGLSAKFLVTGWDYQGGPTRDGEAELAVCKNCLAKLNYNNYRHIAVNRARRDRAVADFSLVRFFSDYSSHFRTMPGRTDLEVQAGSYASDWGAISQEYRKSVDWTCEGCGVDLTSRRNLLHVHHRNFVKKDNVCSNLQALCKCCHSEMPGHDSVFVTQYERREIARLRREQELYRPPRVISHSGAAWEACIKYADPAVRGLLHELQHHGYEVPEVGGDVKGPDGRIVCSNIELVWQNTREAVVLEDGEDKKVLEGVGWTVFFPQELLDELGE